MSKYILVDYRLIHSRIFIKWRKKIGFNELVVCNDQLVSNFMKKATFRAIVPKDLTVTFVSHKELKTYELDEDGVLLVATFKEAIDCCQLFPELEQMALLAVKEEQLCGKNVEELESLVTEKLKAVLGNREMVLCFDFDDQLY